MSFDIYLKEDQLNDEEYLASIARSRDEGKDIKRIVESESFKTKNEVVRELISKAYDKGIPFAYVVADSWFLNGETVNLIESLKKDWVFGCKSDRVVLMPPGWMSLSEWAKTLPKDRFEPVNVWYEKKRHVYWCYATNLKMRSLDGRRIRIVVSYDNKELSGDPHFYCTNKVEWDLYKILSVYARRWRVDVFYRDFKAEPRVGGLSGEENQGCEKAHRDGLHGSCSPSSWSGVRCCCFYRKVRSAAMITKACKRYQGSEGRSQS